uniref:Cystinosin n=1 Tax=Setaria digitata TaxID=48799 RepID=A0A915PW34_9BILA
MTKIVRGVSIHVKPVEVILTIGEDKMVQFYTTDNLSSAVDITLMRSDSFDGTPHIFRLDNQTQSVNVVVTGLQITSHAILEIEKCVAANLDDQCPFSVTGLNFDFLLLNIIGFTCYASYNVLMYFDTYIQELYEQSHPYSLIPVLLNDVVFATHALFACLITALQCFLYERGNQRISYTCWGLSSLLGVSAGLMLILTIAEQMNPLQFITGLSYIKMAVTLSKYFPQAFMNFRRKSTIGWSIGNVLLDFLGGMMDIAQMVLQGANTDDWSIFHGNPVKLGIGMVSIIFDLVFIVQHYVLYRDSNEGATLSTTAENNAEDESVYSDRNILPEIIRVNDEEQHISI